MAFLNEASDNEMKYHFIELSENHQPYIFFSYDPSLIIYHHFNLQPMIYSGKVPIATVYYLTFYVYESET